jgi:hypothetical protein
MSLTYMGLKIVENPWMTKTIEDWSRVRSPSRARRRRWKHKQNIVTRTVPDKNFYMTADTVICHPAMVCELRKAMEDNSAKPTDPATYKTTAPEVKWPSEMVREMMRFGLLRTNPIFRTDVV